jgi:hypothetical protein
MTTETAFLSWSVLDSFGGMFRKNAFFEFLD